MAHKQIYIVDGRRVDPHGNPVDDQGADNSGEEVVSTAEATEPDAMTFSDEVSTVNTEPRRRFQREEDAIEELMTLKGVGEERARMFVRVGWYTKDDLRRAGRDGLIRKASIGEKLADDLLAQLEE